MSDPLMNEHLMEPQLQTHLEALIILASDDPDLPIDEWTPMMAEDVPQAIKVPSTMGRMVHGEEVCWNDVLWFRAIRAGGGDG
jgi:hypothetical protein